jgi:hypothetical protein
MLEPNFFPHQHSLPQAQIVPQMILWVTPEA